MSDSFIEWRKKENICPVVLDGKERYYFDLMNIEHSWTGRYRYWKHRKCLYYGGRTANNKCY